jgi:Tfp pilus assembly protein PilO
VTRKDAWLLASVVVLLLVAWGCITHLENRLEQWQSIQAETRALKQLARHGQELEAKLAPTEEALYHMQALHREVDELLRDLPPGAPCFEEHLPEREMPGRGIEGEDG